MSNIAIVRLQWKLGWAHALLWIASAGRDGEPTPEVHLYLADLHFRLAFEYESLGRKSKAWRHRGIANRHAVLGPPVTPRPAVAMAMPVPLSPLFTDARGFLLEPPEEAS